MTEEELLLKESTEEIRELLKSGAGVRLEIDPMEAYQLVAVIMLALRHPGIVDHTRATAIKIAQDIEKKFAPYPATAECIRRGWHPEYDKPTEEAL